MIRSLFFFFIIFSFITSNANCNIKNKIVAKIGNEIITSYDVINEINTILAISNEVVDEKSFVTLRNVAFQSLKKLIIKQIEVNKYEIEDYNEDDLNNYIYQIEKNLNLQNMNLEDHFKKYGANYQIFIEGIITNLKWNTLIYSLYKRQLDVDLSVINLEVKDQIKKERQIVEFNLSEIVLEKLNEAEIIKIQNNINEIGFEKTANLYSVSATSQSGGNIGWIGSKSISPSYLKVVKGLKINQVSKPIVNINNIVILKLNDKRVLNSKDFNIKKIEQNVINKKRTEKLNVFSNSHYIDLEKKLFIEIND
tara:strand:- start:19266 stop:20192 length:927 start_codon:yes stop_codon:yes gene_type:complete